MSGKVLTPRKQAGILGCLQHCLIEIFPGVWEVGEIKCWCLAVLLGLF